jgi:hypothetical protein
MTFMAVAHGLVGQLLQPSGGDVSVSLHVPPFVKVALQPMGDSPRVFPVHPI